MGGFRVSIACIQDRLVELATDYQVGHAEVLSLTSLLWKLSDAFSARAASAYREQGLVLAVADQRRRDEWLSGLLAGSLSATQVDQGCLTYHVRRDMRLRAFCSGPLGEAALERAQHAILQQWAPQEDVRMMVPSNGHLIGIASSLPPVMRGLLLAAGPEDDIDRMPMSFAIAQGVLAAARLQFTDGIHTLETLGWRVAVPRVADVSDLVHLRYLQPLIDAGPFGVQVVKALRAYLANGRSIPRTAKALHVHVNTLRYQLARFEELTGWPLDETDTLVELSWALYASPLS